MMLLPKICKNVSTLLMLNLVFAALFPLNVHADEWRSCDVYNSLGSEREAAIAFGKIKKRISFFKKQDFANLTIFLDGQTFGSADLIPTGRRLYGDGKPYLGYADKSNTLIVQEFENSSTIIVTTKGDVDFTMFAKCN